MAIRFVFLLLFALSGADGSRIVGGRDAASHSRPYMASLQARGAHICGGVLIREDFVITAASCVSDSPLTVVLGVDSLQGNEQTKQEISVLRSIPHPKSSEKKNDIMLLKLSSRAQLTEAVKRISLKCNPLRQQSRCSTAGWGDIGNNMTLANTLQEVNVTTLSQRACQRRWSKEAVAIPNSVVCAVGARRVQGFCLKDTGGPLVCDGTLAGLVAFSGQECGNPATPDVYTRISCFKRWITMVLNNN